MHPILKSMRKEADGWVKKYVLTYELPDGSLHEYHCATRREEDDYIAELERNGQLSRTIMGELHRTVGPDGVFEDDAEAADAPLAQSGEHDVLEDNVAELNGSQPDKAVTDAHAGGEPNDGLSAQDEDNAAEADAGTPTFTPDAVCIVARTPRDTLVMEREFRYPLNSWVVALPAGLVDPDEDIITCAARELNEETGYELVEGEPVFALPQAGYSSTGLTDETVQIVFVVAERAGAAHTEGSELIEVFELPIAEIGAFLAQNRLPIGTRAQLILELVNAMENRE